MQKRVWLVAVVAVMACADDDGDDGGGSVCGDGICNGNENATSCARDCASSACTSSPDSCTGETICVSGACVAAFPRVYAITNVSVSVPTTNPNKNNEDWDIGGGAPDLYIGEQDGTPITTPVDDQFSATFPGPFEVSLIAGGSITFYIWDEDVSTHDYAFGCQANPVTVTLLRSRTFACSGMGSSFTSTINPK